MLRNMFCLKQGLKPALKDISGYKFEEITDFDKLRVEIRKLEQDHLVSCQKTTPCNIITKDTKGRTVRIKRNEINY